MEDGPVNSPMDNWKKMYGYTGTSTLNKVFAIALFVIALVIILFSFLIMLNAFGKVGTKNDAAFDKGMSVTVIILMIISGILYGVQFSKFAK